MTTTPRDLCFLGDSLIEYFNWQARFPDYMVANLGLAGETAPELLARLKPLTATAYRPEAVVLMTGTNDLFQGSDFLPSYERIVTLLQTAWPKTRVVANGLLPMVVPWLAPDLAPRINTQLEALARRHAIDYLDLGRLVPANEAAALFLEDGVHISDHGYGVWSAAIEQQLSLGGLGRHRL